MKIKPVGNIVVLKKQNLAKKTSTGIFIPGDLVFKIISCLSSQDFKVGDSVIFDQNNCHKSGDFILIKPEFILGVIE